MDSTIRPSRGRRKRYDVRGLPTPVCPCCGSGLLKITASFDVETYELDMYLLDNAECANCKCLITAPTPLDHPNYGR
jgi:hypothetical protein